MFKKRFPGLMFFAGSLRTQFSRAKTRRATPRENTPPTATKYVAGLRRSKPRTSCRICLEGVAFRV
eukprot:14879268-Alexandrium_andersonii.AAC.1